MKEQHDLQCANRQKQVLANCEWFAQSEDIRKFLRKEDYTTVCGLVNRYFFMFADKLKMEGGLNEKEICLCVLVLTDSFTDKQLAEVLSYGEKSIRGIKRYVAQKLGTSSANLRYFLFEMVTQVS